MRNKQKWATIFCAALAAAAAVPAAADEGQATTVVGEIITVSGGEQTDAPVLNNDPFIIVQKPETPSEARMRQLLEELAKRGGTLHTEGIEVLQNAAGDPLPTEGPELVGGESATAELEIAEGSAAPEQSTAWGIPSISGLPYGANIPSAANQQIQTTFQTEGQGTLLLTELRTGNRTGEPLSVNVEKLPFEVLEVEASGAAGSEAASANFTEQQTIDLQTVRVGCNPDGKMQIRYALSAGGKTTLYEQALEGSIVQFSNMDIENLEIQNPGPGRVLLFSDSVNCARVSMNGNRGGLVSFNGGFNEMTINRGTAYVGSERGGTVNLTSGHAQLLLGDNARIHRLNTPSGTMDTLLSGSDEQIGSTGTYVDPNARALTTPDDKKKVETVPQEPPKKDPPPSIG